MTWPTEGNLGWEELRTVAPEEPEVRLLPDVHVASWFDPTALDGAGNLQPAVFVTVGASHGQVRGNVEARLFQPEVFGVVLLDSIGVPTGAPCTLLLTVYADDGVTVLWEVGTDPSHPFPYLDNPDHYEEQELDVAGGSATLGTVRVTVLDVPTLPGDQDSGWLTQRLAALGVPDLAGHRCRLLRFIDEVTGYTVVADGPAGTPALAEDYSSYSWDIRDTRETERAMRAFDTVILSLIPDELPNGYGATPGGGASIVYPARPLRGRFTMAPSFSPYAGDIAVGLSVFPDNGRRIVITRAAYEAILGGLPRSLGVPLMGGASGDQPIPLAVTLEFSLAWRTLGTSDPYTVIPGRTLQVTLSTTPSTVVPEAWVIGRVVFQDRRLNPLEADYDPSAPALPVDGQDVEFFLYGPVAVDQRHPAILESLPPLLDTYGVLNLANYPVAARWSLVASIGGISSGTMDLTADPGNDVAFRSMVMPIFNRLGNLSTVSDIFIPIGGTFAWRAAGTADPWTIIVLDPSAPGGSSVQLFMQTPLGLLSRVFITAILAAADADVPVDGLAIEFTLTLVPPVDEVLTAGQFAVNAYAGLYSAREAATGNVVPTGIRYDEAAVLQIRDVVRIRLIEPIADLRAWLEKHIYQPTGWVPALDRDGLISPVYQGAPQLTDGLAVVDNAHTEAAPKWDAGQRYVNILRFTYFRDFDHGAPDAPIGGSAEERQSDIGTRKVLVEFRDEVSITRHREKVLDIDGSAFRALGATELYSQVVGTQLTKWDGPSAGEALPIPGQVGETAYQLALLRRDHVLNRYSLGAPTMEVLVMRQHYPLLRAGDWVVLNLSWFPDYVTTRRGLLTLAQVVALGDLDCAWRRILVEQVVPLLEGS